MRYNNYNNGRNRNQGHSRRNGARRNVGQSYVWRLSWYDCRVHMDKSRSFRSKVQALMLKSKLDANYNMICVKLEKWGG